MTATIDFLVASSHPRWDSIEAAVSQLRGRLFSCEGSQWQATIHSGSAEWIVLVDQRARVTAADFQTLPENLTYAALRNFKVPDPKLPVPDTAPIWLQPVLAASAAERFIGETCPPAIALCWNNPALYSLVCLRRDSLPKLSEISTGHSEPIWDWLLRSAGRPHRVASRESGSNQQWIFNHEVPTPQIARPQGSVCAPEFIAPEANQIPGLRSQRPVADIEWLVQHIERTKPSQYIPDSDTASIADSVAVKAGLLLWHDAAEASHQLAQSIEGLGTRQAGDYWHAILHRREPDYSNAKYWFRQFDLHPVMSELIPYATQTLQDLVDGRTWMIRLTGKGSWDPLAFVDLCEACAGKENSPLGTAARRIQAAEMQLLMAATYVDASGCDKNGARAVAPHVPTAGVNLN